MGWLCLYYLKDQKLQNYKISQHTCPFPIFMAGLAQGQSMDGMGKGVGIAGANLGLKIFWNFICGQIEGLSRIGFGWGNCERDGK